MEITVLKNFATAARTQLIKEVAARLDIVVQDSSAARREFGAAMAELDQAIQAEGGAAAGRRKVAERVAYTWFNRIIALRFMDANHYTDVGIVSPVSGQTAGQPEVLADAKRGHVDTQVVISKATVERIAGLLNGTVRSDDSQREAYGLLLAAYCQAQHKAMPFMFERDGDYTELLMPADLLSDESVIAKAVKVLTPEICQNVEVIGWLYQFYITERKDEVFAGFSKGKKAGAAEIPAATQLFTPHWIVRYLVENSLGRLWLLNRPDSMLAKHMNYYIAPIEPETDFLKVVDPEELTILDPACGSGHMLTYAFDLLYAIYEEEGYGPSEIPGLILTNNLYGTEIDPRAGALAAFALTMKACARQRTFLGKCVTPNICVLEPIRFSPAELDALVSHDGDRVEEVGFFNQFSDAGILGALIRPKEELIGEISAKLAVVGDTDLFVTDVLSRASRVAMQAEYLSSRYHVVVANPPYMGSKNMSAELSERAKKDWPNSRSDLFAMFIERCLQLAQHGGLVGMITMQSWMFLSSFQKLREDLLCYRRLVSMVHLGTHAFDSIGGDVVSTTAFVIVNESSTAALGTYVRLVDGTSEAAKQAALSHALAYPDCPLLFRASVKDLQKIPGYRIAYWLTESMVSAFENGVPLGAIASPRQGLATADNGRFVRYWHEVSLDRMGLGLTSGEEAKASGKKWFPYNKGGSFRRWYGNQEFMVNWQNDGFEIRNFTDVAGKVLSRPQNTEYYFRSSVSWSKISSGLPAFRYFSSGFIFDVAGTSIYADTLNEQYVLLGYCNSSVVLEILKAFAPTLNFEVGTVASLPIRQVDIGRVKPIIVGLVERSKADWDSDENSWGFDALPLLQHRDLLRIEAAVAAVAAANEQLTSSVKELEEANNRSFIEAYGLDGEIEVEIATDRVSLFANPVFRYGPGKSASEYSELFKFDLMRDLVSYAVGCIFGRYSIDKPGLILADQGGTLQEYVAQVPEPSFEPDKDNVIPILGDDWFDDDIVARFRKFLRVTFGDEHFEENLRFVEGALGKDIRRYLVNDFYRDHVKRYKKRPIYWLFSSPKGSFNALIYMHRYQPSTVSTVLNEYLREFQAKLGAALENQQRISDDPSTLARDKVRADKEIDKLRSVLQEVRDYEHDVLYPLATRQIAIDLDDGVKVNYPKLGVALRKISGLEAASG